MEAYGLFGKLQAQAGKGDELASILIEASEIVSSADGCYIYLVNRDVNDNDSIWVYEVWRNKQDHDNSLKMEGVRELISKAMPLLSGQPEKGLELEVIGGKGIEYGC
jgi:quinol monooxygenase YgiN